MSVIPLWYSLIPIAGTLALVTIAEVNQRLLKRKIDSISVLIEARRVDKVLRSTL